MSANKKLRSYVKDSTIPLCGKGLFALTDIKKGLIIAEFKGILKSENTVQTQKRSNIFFNDNSYLDCYPNDIASYANDAIDITRNRRKLIDSLKENEPFYKKHKNTNVNASIKLYENVHRAVLIALCDIKKDEEIFCHYGFNYWFNIEATQVGFMPDEELDKNASIDQIYKYPAFTKYIYEFYNDIVKIEYKQYDETTTDVILHYKSTEVLVMPFPTKIVFDKVDLKDFV